MGEAARAAPPPIVVELDEFVTLRRPHTKKAACSWVRDAKSGKIPGAFQMGGRGQWYVNLDTYDEEVRRMSSPKAPASGDRLLALAEKLNITPAQVELAIKAARC